MKYCVTGQEEGDLLIQVIAWVGLTVYYNDMLDCMTFCIIR